MAPGSLLAHLPELGRLGRLLIAGGRAGVRTALWMAALTSIRRNPPIRALYRRLVAAGWLKKLALLVCASKLLSILNAILHNRQPWQGDVHAAALI